jgi:uncharacterized protein (TIGR02646 family)
MIKIDRGPVPNSIKVYATKNVKALDGVTLITKAEREIELSLAFHTNPTNYLNEVKLTKNCFDFKIYKNKELTEELERFFGKKCAYCESRFAHITPKDIEHFRPKSEIKTDNGVLRPGYFWLACEWENLLISCPDCNRARSHEVPGQPVKITLGKATQFPLSDERKRIRSRGSLTTEEAVRLLINPCIDEPMEHLTFDDQGLIRPRVDDQGNHSQMGLTSINVYALQRKALVEERLRVIDQLKFQVKQLGALIRTHNKLTAFGASRIDLADNANQIREVRDNIKSMFVRDQPYLAMLREWIRIGNDQGHFNNLLQFGIDLTNIIR